MFGHDNDPVFPSRINSPNAGAERRAVETCTRAIEDTLHDPARKKYHFFWTGGILPAISSLSFPAAYKIAANDPEQSTSIYLWTYNHRDLVAQITGETWHDDGAMYSGFEEDLSSYDPSIFHVAPAHMLIPGCVAGRLLHDLHMSLAHLSDIARFVAILKYGGVMMDVDCVLLRPVPRTRFFSTCEPKRRGGVAQSEAYWQKYGVTDLVHPEEWDGRGILCYPVGAPPGDSIIESVVVSVWRQIESALNHSKKSFSWGLTTETLRDIVCEDASARRDIIPPIYTVPYPWWGKPGKKLCTARGMCFTLCPEYTTKPKEMFGSRIPTTAETMQTSWMVSHFFHSYAPNYMQNFRVDDFTRVDTKQKRGVWWNTPGRIPEGSVLHAELLHVFGDSPPRNVDVREWQAKCPVKHIF